MYLSITSTHQPATDLGFLLHKHPARAQSFSLSFGQVHVFYPEASEGRCTATLLLDIDPIGLIRGGQKSSHFKYVNDRPYVASSFLSVAIAQVYSSALSGRCKQYPELVEKRIPLEATLAAIPSRGGKQLIKRLFEPLGYEIQLIEIPLDEQFPEWGRSPYYQLTLRQEIGLKDLLSHLYVLIPVLDNQKHYFVGEDELGKLFKHGEKWLSTHPEYELITKRYLKYSNKLVATAISHLEELHNPMLDDEESEELEEKAEKPFRLHDIRLQQVVDQLKLLGAKSVLDLGCGDGKLLRLLGNEKCFTRIVGVDVSYTSLQIAKSRLERQKMNQVELWHGSVLYRDKRWIGFDAATVVEVIEHLEIEQLSAFEQILFGHARHNIVILTTPNVEYNVRFESLASGQFRHKDHRFEWTRAEFQAWAKQVANRFEYEVKWASVGPIDEEVGSPTQMAIFQLRNGEVHGDNNS
ncbi:3' terminal RNA ribose 2'-O-methyltransferase Hen1 [Thermoflavimicrobium daqui]|uniref:Small RNA 2'-O-methyltransferase n=1 Tax=Thermoflavimicrobium daqui TaxID=2137476 RepID=A0A364K0U6_9BACL|nr:3' terminal RNA ribose 2'-O-methyltransferase Hen1 [Thermoflavimicrobium daqui]RAL21311.1 3' terminal RNA ribose 2'-O-methyltransferase Hen1 [Thermoflavimicrobium daqui]